MRYPEFKMERENLVKVGDRVTFTESQLPSSYYYTIVPAVAMSRNYAPYERIQSREGVVADIRDTPRGYYVVLRLDEDPVETETEEDFQKMLNQDKTEAEDSTDEAKPGAEADNAGGDQPGAEADSDTSGADKPDGKEE